MQINFGDAQARRDVAARADAHAARRIAGGNRQRHVGERPLAGLGIVDGSLARRLIHGDHGVVELGGAHLLQRRGLRSARGRGQHHRDCCLPCQQSAYGREQEEFPPDRAGWGRR